jgi:hypothetical protein
VMLFVVLLMVAGAAHAGLPRTAVSRNGNDANPCTIQLPCATFARAISETSPLGELIALDSGGYDGFTIDRGMTVTAAPGAVVTVGKEPGTTNWAIKVQAPGKRVSIRGLMVVTVGGNFGIVAHDAMVTHIDDVMIEGSGCENGCGTAIFGRRGDVFVNNARIRNVFTGISHNPLEPATMTVTNSNIDNADLAGVMISNYGKGIVRNTTVSRAGSAFSAASSTKGVVADLVITDCMATNSTTGVDIGSQSRVNVDRSVITRNGYGLKNSGGVITTHTNSMISGNGTDTWGPMTADSLL